MINLVENIKRTFALATDTEIANGTAWYPNARALAIDIADGNLEMGAGVIAALSPRMPWTRNVVLARQAFESGLTGGCLGANIVKANRIMAGEAPLDVLGGDKVRAFYSNIVDPLSDAVTIDAHAFDIAMGVKYGKDRPAIGKIVFRELSEAYRAAAIDLGFMAPEIQAITWVAHRRIHNVNV